MYVVYRQKATDTVDDLVLTAASGPDRNNSTKETNLSA